jgi:hypothetical protein
MTQSYWFERKELGGFTVQRSAVGAADLSVMPLGPGRWSWLVRRAGVDIAEGEADSLAAAQQAAEAAAHRR